MDFWTLAVIKQIVFLFVFTREWTLFRPLFFCVGRVWMSSVIGKLKYFMCFTMFQWKFFFCLFVKQATIWVLYLTLKQLLLLKCVTQSLARALLWTSPTVARASLTSSTALETHLFSPVSLLNVLAVRRTSCCGHSGRKTLLLCDLGQVFKGAWYALSQGKLLNSSHV